MLPPDARQSSILSAATVLFVALAALVTWQTTSAQDSALSATEASDDVADSGNKSMLRLQEEVDIAEARFFGVFNSLNRDSDYDVECEYEMQLSTRRNAHICKARFQRKYEAELAMVNTGGYGGIAERPQPSEWRLKKKQERFGKRSATRSPGTRSSLRR